MCKKSLIVLSALLAFGIFLGASGMAVACGENEGMITIKKTADVTDGTFFNFSIAGTNGNAAASLRSGYSTTKDLPVGTYAVSETPLNGWQQVSVVCERACGCNDNDCAKILDPANIVLEKKESVTCTFTNSKIKKGHLVVQKTTVPGGDLTVFNITASGNGTITGGGAGTVTDAIDKDYEVTAGTYSVAEEANAAWTTVNACGNIVVAAGETKYCQITNTKKPKLTVVKEVVPENDGGKFNLLINGATIVSNVGDDGTTGAQYANVGDNTFGETAGTGTELADYTMAITGEGCDSDGTITLAAGDNKTCTITNTAKPKKGTLIVKKVLAYNYGTDVDADEFSFTVNDGTAAAFEEDGQNDLTVEAGTYDVDEVAAPGYVTTYGYNGTDSCEAVVVPAGGTATCTITNSDIQPKLTVVKTIVNGPAKIADFTYKVGDTEVTSGQENLINVGTYTVSESTSNSLFDTIYDKRTIGGACAANGTVTLKSGDVKTCTITNEDDDAAKLIVIKRVVNDNGGTADANDFTIQVTGENVFNPTFAGDENGTTVYLDDGAYSVTEGANSGYTATMSADCSGTLAIGETKTCTITNDDIKPNPATLTLVKKVDCGIRMSCMDKGCAKATEWTLTATEADDDDDVVAATVALSGAGGATGQVAPGIYALAESEGPDGYTAGTWTCVGGQLDGNLLTLAAGQTATCTITNTKDIVPPVVKTGKIKVVKYAIGGNGTQVFSFAGIPGITTIAPTGNIWGKMAKGNWTSGDLTAGTKYTVTETVPTGWKQITNTCKNVKVKAGKTVTCVIINKKVVEKPACDPKKGCCKDKNGRFTNCIVDHNKGNNDKDFGKGDKGNCNNGKIAFKR